MNDQSDGKSSKHKATLPSKKTLLTDEEFKEVISTLRSLDDQPLTASESKTRRQVVKTKLNDRLKKLDS